MTRVNSYIRGPELKKRQKDVIAELRIEPILRQLERDIQEAVMEFLKANGGLL